MTRVRKMSQISEGCTFKTDASCVFRLTHKKTSHGLLRKKAKNIFWDTFTTCTSRPQNGRDLSVSLLRRHVFWVTACRLVIFTRPENCPRGYEIYSYACSARKMQFSPSRVSATASIEVGEGKKCVHCLAGWFRQIYCYEY